ncbi:Hypothetical predicted protein [Mytilus galloprovincialis]|uniref:Small integral membrane protein 13 n=1 Tax=Mytilus galloprovincialis TaxID=29158 RepID=A0A8B6F6G0_MYTGA|nr:Hypothetical predicted protein [Mytilus galloprovincialis]
MKEIFLSLITFIASFSLVILFIAIGWYIVWKVFLSRFNFVQELLGKNGSESKEEFSPVPRKPRTKIRRD